jgi:hypothetical protein
MTNTYKKREAYGTQIYFHGNDDFMQFLTEHSDLIGYDTNLSLLDKPFVFVYFKSTYTESLLANSQYYHRENKNKHRPDLTGDEKFLCEVMMKRYYCIPKKYIWVDLCDQF